MTLIVGIDESGRGPVLGPLVMAGVLIDDSDEHKLAKLGVKDSKLLTPQQREQLFDKVIKIAKASEIVIVQPSDIDRAVIGHDGLNLNWLEADKSIEIIKALKPDKAILDCPSNNIKKYADYLKQRLPKGLELIAEHKADVKYPVVSAASILAKVTRDREIQKLQETISEPIGSGYPSDPVTCEFLKHCHKTHKHLFRKSWATYQEHENKKSQKRLDDF